MSRRYFDRELDHLHTDLLTMGAMIEDAIEKSIKALEENQTFLGVEVIQNDQRIDDIEKKIEKRCLSLLLRQQPVAKDLRAISTAIKMITDMERIGDQAADIADIAIRDESTNLVDLAPHIKYMAKIAAEMVKSAVESFAKGDLLLAKQTQDKDDLVDEAFVVVKNQLIDILKSETDYHRADAVINAMMIAKYLERIGDHAGNICEWVEFYQTGIYKETKLL